jgi:hypothetical protein
MARPSQNTGTAERVAIGLSRIRPADVHVSPPRDKAEVLFIASMTPDMRR